MLPHRSRIVSTPVAKFCGVAFKPKLQPPRQILLAELLAGLPVVQGVAVRREQRHEARIEAVGPMPLMDGLPRVLKGVVDQVAEILQAIGADGDGARHEPVHVRPELVMLAFAGAAAKGAQDRVRRDYNGLTKGAARCQLDELHEIVVVVLVQLLAGERDFDSVLTGDDLLVHLAAVFAFDRGKQGAAGNDIRDGRRVVGEGQGELNDLRGRARLCGLLGGASLESLVVSAGPCRRLRGLCVPASTCNREFELIRDLCR